MGDDHINIIVAKRSSEEIQIDEKEYNIINHSSDLTKRRSKRK